MRLFQPDTTAQLQDCIRTAGAENRPLELIGGGTKRRIGRPMDVRGRLELSGLKGIRSYQPAELVLTAGTGTPLDEIEAAVAEHGQHLVFEPADLRAVLGSVGHATLGGTIAANLSGPRRVMAGATRDHLLGFVGVTGRGELVKSGGTVVKNVTGYDLPKLLCGSWGTLMALSEVSVRVLPSPRETTTLVFPGLDAEAATRLMSRALGSQFEVSGAAWLPAALTRYGANSETLLRLEASSRTRADALARFLSSERAMSVLDHETSLGVWRQVRDASGFSRDDNMALWRVSVPPNKGASVVASLPKGDAYLDWGGGLVWVRAPLPDGGENLIRGVIAETGGHATLIRGEDSLRRDAPVFQPLEPPLAALVARVKQAFDPLKILNPGRLYAES